MSAPQGECPKTFKRMNRKADGGLISSINCKFIFSPFLIGVFSLFSLLSTLHRPQHELFKSIYFSKRITCQKLHLILSNQNYLFGRFGI